MNDLLTLSFAALAVLFTFWNGMTVSRYVRYRRLVPEAILTWESSRPWYYNLCMGIGFLMVALTSVSAFVLHRPTVVVVAEALMAVFYTLVFPLTFRIRRGFYASGIWAERGFVPYRRIRWLGWKETPRVELALRVEGLFRGQGYSFLLVPGEHFGQARRILADSIEEQALSLETSVLGLEPEVSTRERV